MKKGYKSCGKISKKKRTVQISEKGNEKVFHNLIKGYKKNKRAN